MGNIEAEKESRKSERMTILRSFIGRTDRLFMPRRPGRPGTEQDSLPVAGQGLPGGIRCPQGPNERLPRDDRYRLSQPFLAD